MAKDANLSIRVDKEVKEQAEEVLKRLGIPMSSAINIFLNQIIIRQGLPFDVKISEPVFIEDLTEKELIEMLEEAKNDDGIPFEEVKKYYKGKYKIWITAS